MPKTRKRSSPSVKNTDEKKIKLEAKLEKKNFWLFKSEPNTRVEKGQDMKFSFEDLKAESNSTACWDGVRSYQARNFMKEMKIGDEAFFYHSNCKPPGIVGIVEVVKESYVDHTQFDSKDPHFDSKATKENPRWFMVDVRYVRPLKRQVNLAELKERHFSDKAAGDGALARMAMFTKARLSVQPIAKQEWDAVLDMEADV